MDGFCDDGRPVLLVLRALKLGDLLVAVPALHGLRRAFPEHRLLYAAQGWLDDAVALVGGFELLPTHGLDEPLALDPGTVDVAVNLHGRGPESQQRIEALQANQTISHRSDSGPGPAWLDGIHERERWTRLLQWHGIHADPRDLYLETPGGPTQHPEATLVHVGAAYGSRLWPAERFAEVAGRLRDAGHSIVFTGGAADRHRAVEVALRAGVETSAVLAGRQSLGQFAASVAAARLVVSADTGAAHLASAYGRPSVVLFGPAPPEEWGPPPGPHIALTKAELRRGDTFAPDPDPALLGVSTQSVLDAVRELGLL
jgi:ADP-heptose:LPS heptosyltransferase